LIFLTFNCHFASPGRKGGPEKVAIVRTDPFTGRILNATPLTLQLSAAFAGKPETTEHQTPESFGTLMLWQAILGASTSTTVTAKAL
jgi:hypothetical protein